MIPKRACLVVAAVLWCSVSAVELSIAGHFPYKMHSLPSLECNYTLESCAPLSDLWALDTAKGESFALVGVINGMSIVDVTDVKKPREVGFIPGCLTEWRDLKTLGDHLFYVHDQTDLCSCFSQPCQDTILVESSAGTRLVLTHEIRIGPGLNRTGDVRAELAAASPQLACGPQSVDLAGKIALIQRGDCTFSEKLLSVQNAGAVGAIIVNEREDVVPPSMLGHDMGVAIPAVLVSGGDGAAILGQLKAGRTLVTTLTENGKQYNDLFKLPDGLTVVDMSSPASPKVVLQTRQWFSYSHNIYIEEDRSLLYACGVSCHPQDLSCTDGLQHGGIIVLDISEPSAPVLVAQWDDLYIHDVVVVTDPLTNRRILFGAAIYDSRVYRFDVTHIDEMFQTVFYWLTPEAAHNTWPIANLSVIYVTHEDDAMPITIYDISNPLLPVYLSNISVGIQNKTIPHNVFVRDTLLWASYYSEGVIVWDVSRPTQPARIASLDTSVNFFNGYHGVWGIYPLPSNKRAYASDIEAGLFILDLSGYPTEVDDNDDSDDEGHKRSSKSRAGVTAAVVVVVLLVTLTGVYLARKWRAQRPSRGNGRRVMVEIGQTDEGE